MCKSVAEHLGKNLNGLLDDPTRINGQEIIPLLGLDAVRQELPSCSSEAPSRRPKRIDLRCRRGSSLVEQGAGSRSEHDLVSISMR